MNYLKNIAKIIKKNNGGILIIDYGYLENNMNFIKKRFFALFISIYFLIGSINSLNTGISFDENYEELNWKFHVSFVKEFSTKLLSKEKFEKEKLKDEAKRFVGYG